mmetsp:Transcript_21262/g.43723  ORF Transcript_21262/g.43723 Transcript_21262/m.43723 type:complete len:251 (+) Transcript_21262:419-1171(+)
MCPRGSGTPPSRCPAAGIPFAAASDGSGFRVRGWKYWRAASCCFGWERASWRPGDAGSSCRFARLGPRTWIGGASGFLRKTDPNPPRAWSGCIRCRRFRRKCPPFCPSRNPCWVCCCLWSVAEQCASSGLRFGVATAWILVWRGCLRDSWCVLPFGASPATARSMEPRVRRIRCPWTRRSRPRPGRFRAVAVRLCLRLGLRSQPFAGSGEGARRCLDRGLPSRVRRERNRHRCCSRGQHYRSRFPCRWFA